MGKTCLWKRAVLFFICYWQMACLSAQEAIIKGRVQNDRDVLPAATVRLAGQTMLTNEEGEFSFPVKAGTGTLTITHANYKKSEQIITVNAGETRTVVVVLEPEELLDEVVLVGSRSAGQPGKLTTPVPVDVFSAKQLQQTGQINLTQMLQYLVPSFNASRELLNEPVTLRGLDPQHLLILLNGTRFHNQAWFFGGSLKGELGRGSAGNDLTAIPFSAIEKVEILRDGASALYGSDAIAGVINIRLKEKPGTTSIHLHTGQYDKSDGEKFSLGFHRGFSLGKKGFLNLSADYRYQEPAYRGGVYQGTVYTSFPSNASHEDSIRVKAIDDSLIATRGFDRQSVLDNAGTLKSVRAGALMNGTYAMHNHTEVFWTAAYNSRNVWRDAAYRFPKNPGQVNLALYPDGFQAKTKANTIDVSTITGIKGEMKNKIRWNVTSSYGNNASRYDVSNTNNPSQSFMGKAAPTSFYAGRDVYQQLTNNINLSKTWKPVRVQSVNLAVGGEWRWENLRTGTGEEASWRNYDPTGQKQGGVGGTRPEDVLNKRRNTFGAYFDLETGFLGDFLLNVAGRYEYYSDFGGNVAGKLAARYRFSERFMVRASVNNGFRAPSLQQRYSISTDVVIDRTTGRPLFSGLFPNDHAVAKALGIPLLTAERTLNASGGFTAKPSRRNSLTLDVYWIQIKNRVVLSYDFDRDDNRSLDSILRPYTNLSQITQVSFFSNAINTRTYGVDLVWDGFFAFPKAVLRYTLAANVNCTHVFGKIQTPRNLPATDENTNLLFSRADRANVERGQPQEKIILKLQYQKGKLGAGVTNTWFGSVVVWSDTDAKLDETYPPRIVTDLAVHYQMKAWMTIIAGANNAFQIYPGKIRYYENSAQGIYIYNPGASPFGFYGGYYYVGINFDW